MVAGPAFKRGATLVDKLQEELFQSIGLVPETDDTNVALAQSSKHLVQCMRLRYANFQCPWVHQRGLTPAMIGAASSACARFRTKCSVCRLESSAHIVALGDLAVIDDGNIATEALSLFQVVGRQDDSRAVRVDLTVTLTGVSRYPRQPLVHPVSTAPVRAPGRAQS